MHPEIEARRMVTWLDLAVDHPYLIDAKNQLNNFNFRWMLKRTLDEGTTVTRRR